MDDLDLSPATLDAAVRGTTAPPAPGSRLPAPIRNNNPGALMPGGKLATYRTPEEGLQALDQNLQSYGQQGVGTLRSVISKWAPPNENNTDAYIRHVAQVTGLNPDQPIDLRNAYTRHQISAGIVQHENGAKALYQPGAAANTSGNAGPGELDSATLDAAVRSAVSAQPPARTNRLQPPDFAKAGDSARGVAANYLTSMGANIVGGWRGLTTLATGGSLDDAANDVNDYVARHTYRGDSDNQRQAIEQFNSSRNPLNWPVEGVGALSDLVADKVGPAAGAVTKTAGIGALTVLGLRGRPGTAPVEVGPARPAVGIYRPLQLGDNPTAAALGQQVPRQPAAAGQAATPGPGQQVGQPAPQPASSSVPVSRPPAAPTAKPEEAFPEIGPGESLGNVKSPTPEMQRRAQVLASVGIDQARESSLTGDKIGGSTDLQISKEDSPRGRYMLDQLTKEKQVLADHSLKLAQDTGGSVDNGPKDQVTLYQRGKTIVAPMKQLEDYYDAKARGLYQAADERAQGVPVKLDGFGASLNDPSLITQPSHPLFQNAVKAKAAQIGMQVGEDGSISGTAKQAEVLRKFLNQNGKGANAGFASSLKEGLDNDVMSSAGDDLYTQARALWAQKKNTLDNPNGIAKLMSEEGPNGINRAVPFEQISNNLSGMPVDQFGHVVNTLKNAPKEIQPSATAALNEIRAHFANEVRNVGTSQQGQWNAKGVMNYLRQNAARMNQVFTPEEMGRFQNLSEAGQIVAKDQSYPGAAVQAHNLARSAAAGALRSSAGTVGAVAGHAVLGPVGATLGYAAGKAVGEKTATGLTDRAALSATQRRTVKLSDLLNVR